jgi:pSer/pThr/pTyr-binding forkhead associated (FHA) protein
MFLGRTVGAAPSGSLNAENALCQLELHDGWWHMEDLRAPNGIKVNGRTCKRERLLPGDEIAIGRHRFRIAYETPKAGAKVRPAPDSVSRTPAPSNPIASPALSAAVPSPDLLRKVRAMPPGILGRLIPLGGGVDFVLSKPEITIGRSSSCDVVLASAKVSSRHGQFQLVNGYWRVQDLGSRNGIAVDGVKCDEAWIYPDSQVSLADCRFQLEYIPAGPRPQQDLIVARPTGSLLDKLGVTAEEVSRIVAGHPLEDEIPQRNRFDILKDLKRK